MLLEKFKIQTGSTLSFVGAGGKTSLIFYLAYELNKNGYKVLVTTTTAMFHPKFSGLNYHPLVLFGDELLSCRKQNFPCDNEQFVFVAADRYNEKSKKLIGYDPRYIDYIAGLGFFDFILVEADGARMKSIKCPAPHEPVVPEVSSVVVGCIGLDSIGKQINHNNVHRPCFLQSLCKVPDFEIINQNTVITLAVSEKGLFKGIGDNTTNIVFLNKADDINSLKNGREIAFKIKSNYSHIDFVIVACLKDTVKPIKIIL